MKTKTLLMFACISLQLSAQQIPNSSFDSVYFGGIDRVFNWITSDGTMMGAGTWNDTVLPLQPNTLYPAIGFQFHELLWMGQRVDTSPFSNIAMQLWSHPEKVKQDGSHYESMIVNGEHFRTDSAGFLDLARSGIPFTGRPEVLYGKYRFIDSTLIGLNTGRCIILLKKWNSAAGHSDTIGFADNSTNLAPQAGWSPFQIPIMYRSNDIPDSLVIAFIANSRPDQKSILWLDELMFGPAVGITENKLLKVNVYPNPASESISITNSHLFKHYNIYDIQGRMVKKGKVGSTLEITDLSIGQYVIKLMNNKDQLRTLTFVISR